MCVCVRLCVYVCVLAHIRQTLRFCYLYIPQLKKNSSTTTLWLIYLDSKETSEEKIKGKLHKEVACCFNKILEVAAPYKTTAVRTISQIIAKGLVLWRINNCRLFNAKSIFTHLNSSIL